MNAGTPVANETNDEFLGRPYNNAPRVTAAGPFVVIPLVTAVLYFLVPADFVVPSPEVARATYLFSAATLVVAIILSLRSAGTRESWIVISLIFLAVIPFVSAGNAVAGLFTVTPIIVGTVIGTLFSPRRLIVFAAVMSIVLVSESVLQSHWYSDMTGVYRFENFGVVDFRARGLIGQPVPAAFIVVALSVPCAVFFLRNRQWKWLSLSMGSLLTALATTGTRSALLVAAISLLVAGLSMRHLIVQRFLSALFVTVLVLSSVAAWVVFGGWSATARLFSFSSIGSSESGLVRANALTALTSIPNPCGARCTLLGHGGRQFEKVLAETSSSFGLSTVDNQFVTIFWDFGVLGLGALLAVVIVAIRVLLSRNHSQMAKLGASVVLIILASGLFYDALYVRSSAVIFGIGLGVLLHYWNYHFEEKLVGVIHAR